MSEDTQKAVAVRDTSNLPNLRHMLQRWELEAGLDGGADDNLALQFEQMERLLTAETEDELFAAQQLSVTASKDFLDRVFRLMGPEDIRKRKSAFQNFPFYVIMRVLDVETNEYVTVGSGASNIVAILDRLIEWDDESRENRSFEPYRQYGGRGFMFTSKQTANGFNLVFLKPVNLAPPTAATGANKRAKKS